MADPGNMWEEHVARRRVTLKEKNSCDEREKDVPKEVMLTKICYLRELLEVFHDIEKQRIKFWQLTQTEREVWHFTKAEKRFLLCIVNDPTRRWWQALFRLLLVRLAFVARSCDIWDLLVSRSKGSSQCALQWKYEVLTIGPPGKPILAKILTKKQNSDSQCF